MMLDIMPDLMSWLPHALPWSDPVHTWIWNMPHDWTVLAQQFNEDPFANFRAAVDNFIKTGQVWAFLIGLVLGYLIKGFTSYG